MVQEKETETSTIEGTVPTYSRVVTSNFRNLVLIRKIQASCHTRESRQSIDPRTQIHPSQK
jgi:hypothetical protein